jgi:uncharacterized protein YdhG (YjbR/CyaY superfamily)
VCPRGQAGEVGSMSSSENPQSIDDYIAGFPPDVQAVLEEVRRIIRLTAPEAEETISYRIPTFRLNGNLVHFAAFKNHLGFYPTPSAINHFQQELAPYKGGKGSIRFPWDETIPYDVIRKIVEFRREENLSSSEAKQRNK